MVFRTPSAASVVAVLALLVALSGTSAAAVSLVLPRDSVGTPQLKANSVTSAKIARGSVESSDVKDRSLRRSDFAPGQVPTGPLGPGNAYTSFVRGPVAVPFHADATLANLAIPQAGSYVLLAKALVSGHGAVTCRLEAETDADMSQATPAASSNQTIGAVLPHTFAGSGNAQLKCAGDGDAGASFIRIVALQVGAPAPQSG